MNGVSSMRDFFIGNLPRLCWLLNRSGVTGAVQYEYILNPKTICNFINCLMVWQCKQGFVKWEEFGRWIELARGRSVTNRATLSRFLGDPPWQIFKYSH